MSKLTEAVEISRAKQLESVALKEEKERQQKESQDAERITRQKAVEQAYSQGKQVLDEAHVLEVLQEVNAEYFNEGGQFSNERTVGHIWKIGRAGDSQLDETDYTSRVSLVGKVGNTLTLVRAEAIVKKPAHAFRSAPDPILRISCFTEKPSTYMSRILQRGSQWDFGNGKYDALRPQKVEGQEESAKEWQDIDMVRKSFANVLVDKGVV